MTNRDDEKAEELGMEISKHKVGSPGRLCAQARYEGFMAGCQHVRNSAEWKAMEEVVSLAELYCCLTTQLPSSQEMLIKLRAVLQELDRLRGEERG